MKKKIAIIGNFGDTSKVSSDGQTVKTRSVTNELIKLYGSDSIITFNTYGGIKNLFKAPIICIKALLNASNVIIFPAQNGVRVFVPLLFILSFFIKKRRLHYCVIGGWLPSLIKNKRFLAKALKRFYKIYVETNTMRLKMADMHFNNVVVMPNFKNILIVDNDNLSLTHTEPYKLCTFSRVMKEKGIGDAVEIVKRINSKQNRIVYTLDIYGKIDPNQKEWFENLQSTFPNYISYKGCIDFDKSVNTIKNYFALLFPTHYFTEGIPGTIIDAYAAGVPVVSAKWQSYVDIIDDGKTGYCYEFDNVKEFEQILIAIANTPALITSLKPNCIKQAESYLPKNAMEILLKNLI